MKFTFKTLIVALLCDHQAQSGLRHDMISMIFSMCVTSPVPNYLWLVTERHDPVIARFIASFIANLLTLGEESCCVDTACNISLPWTPATSFGCYLGNVGRAIFFLDTQEIVARNVVRWNVLHSLSLTSVPRARCCHVAFPTLWIAQCLYTFSDSALRFTCGRRPKQFDASTYNNGCLDKQNPTAITPDARAGIKLQVKTRVWTHDTHGFDASKQSSDRNVLVNDLLGIGLNAVATTITPGRTCISKSRRSLSLKLDTEVGHPWAGVKLHDLLTYTCQRWARCLAKCQGPSCENNKMQKLMDQPQQRLQHR